MNNGASCSTDAALLCCTLTIAVATQACLPSVTSPNSLPDNGSREENCSSKSELERRRSRESDLSRSSSINNNNDDGNNNNIRLLVRPDSDKKSVYWLDPPIVQSTATAGEETDLCATSPGYHTLSGGAAYNCQLDMHKPQKNDGVDIDATSSIGAEHTTLDSFYVGGFQLVSNARQVEVYLVTADKNGQEKEAYLTTVKGLKTTIPTPDISINCWFKAMCVIPGGPRPVTAVRLQLQHLQPSPLTANSGTDFLLPPLQLLHIRWTLRLPDTSDPTTTTASASSTGDASTTNTAITSTAAANNAASFTNTTTRSTHYDGNQNDPAVAAAGLAFAIRSAEERVLRQMTTQTVALQAQLTAATQQIAALSATVHILQQQQHEQQQINLTASTQLDSFAISFQETVTSLLKQQHEELLQTLSTANSCTREVADTAMTTTETVNLRDTVVVRDEEVTDDVPESSFESPIDGYNCTLSIGKYVRNDDRCDFPQVMGKRIGSRTV